MTKKKAGSKKAKKTDASLTALSAVERAIGGPLVEKKTTTKKAKGKRG